MVKIILAELCAMTKSRLANKKVLSDDAYYILQARYAKGEITKEQFEQMMRDLKQQA